MLNLRVTTGLGWPKTRTEPAHSGSGLTQPDGLLTRSAFVGRVETSSRFGKAALRMAHESLEIFMVIPLKDTAIKSEEAAGSATMGEEGCKSPLSIIGLLPFGSGPALGGIWMG
ncbi:uncharacterized protein A4U43_C07F16460 [Asparagus officinalis]|uniref:Uncharacterized protein n=1 Tax=Asparagus officinalis TaxID=4686 RepID=A0A5P1ECM0_ASPOF|nr:uncharacterized protein A4U43_C07F16460 [Asparagus officinalis]